MMGKTCETCLRGPTPSLTLRYCAECGDERKYHALMHNRPEPEAVDYDALKNENERLRAGIGACHRMLLAEANTIAALNQAEVMLFDLLLPNAGVTGA